MKKRNVRKLFASVMAGTMALSLMPVSALADTTKTEIDIDVVDTVIRVQVPTYAVVSIDEFEQNDVGTQIFSSDFEIKNYGSTAVKVNISSEFATSADVNYVENIDAISGTNDAWIAAAAAVATGTDDPYVYSTVSGFAGLSADSENVSTVENDAGKYVAKQSFYLDAATGTASYTIVSGTDISSPSNKKKLDYSQLFELTEETNPTFVDSTPAFDKDALLSVVEGTTNNVIYIVEGTSGKITRIDKDVVYANIDNLSAIGVDLSDSPTYYTATEVATALGDLDDAKIYVYGSLATATTAGTSSFRYIGKLAQKEDSDWSNTAISKVTITYTIKCLNQTDYTEAVDGLTMGYKPGYTGPVFTCSAGVITYTDGTGNCILDETTIKVLGINKSGQEYNILEKVSTSIKAASCDYDNNKITIGAGQLANLSSMEATVEFTTTTGQTIQRPITLQ